LEEVDLGTNPQKPRPISIRSKNVKGRKIKTDIVVEKVHRCLCMGLQRDARVRPKLVMHKLNVDPEAKSVAQPARVFHTEREELIVKEV